MSTATKTPPQPWVSGFCNPANPPTSHDRCRGGFTNGTEQWVPCMCAHHHAATLEVPTQQPCLCWAGPVSLHDGHCCFRPGAPDDCHDAEGRQAIADLLGAAS